MGLIPDDVLDDIRSNILPDTFWSDEIELLTEAAEYDMFGESPAPTYSVARTVTGSVSQRTVTAAVSAELIVQDTRWVVSMPWDTTIAGVDAYRLKGTDTLLWPVSDNRLSPSRWSLQVTCREQASRA